MQAAEKIAILDYTTGKVIISTISQREEASDFFERKGLKEDDIEWMRGDIQVVVEE